MRKRLQHLWNIPAIWLVCFAILFGKDVAIVDLHTKFDLFSLLEIFAVKGNITIAYPQILPVLTAMLRRGLLAVNQEHPESTSTSFKKICGDEAETVIAKSSVHVEQGAPFFTASGEDFGKIRFVALIIIN